MDKDRLNRLLGRPGARLMASNALWLVGDRVVRVLLALSVGAWLARHLGPSAFGQLAYAISFVVLFQGVANLSADGVVVRDLARRPEDAHAILGSIFVLRLACGLMCWATIAALLIVMRPDDKEALLLIALAGASLVFQPGEVVDLWFQSQSENRRSVVAKLCSYVLAYGFRIGLILADAPLWAFALAVALDAALLAAALGVVYRRTRRLPPWSAVPRQVKAILRECWPFMLSALAGAGYLRADQILVKEQLGDHALGLFASAIQASQVWGMLPVTVVTALAPWVAKLRVSDVDAYERAIVLIFRAFFYTGLALAALTSVSAGFIIEVLYGPAYSSAAGILAIHSFTNLFVFLGAAHNLWLYNSGHAAVRLVGTIAAGAFSILMNWWALPRYGLEAAAWVAIGAQAIVAFLINLVLAPRSFLLQLQAIAFLPRKLPPLPR